MWPRKTSRKELKKMMDRGDKFIFVGARNSDSYKDEHIKGSISMPLGEVDEKAERMLGKDDEIIVYCSSFSCSTRTNEVRRLKEVGFKNIKHYASGIKDWKKAGYPTEAGWPFPEVNDTPARSSANGGYFKPIRISTAFSTI